MPFSSPNNDYYTLDKTKPVNRIVLPSSNAGVEIDIKIPVDSTTDTTQMAHYMVHIIQKDGGYTILNFKLTNDSTFIRWENGVGPQTIIDARDIGNNVIWEIIFKEDMNFGVGDQQRFLASIKSYRAPLIETFPCPAVNLV
jgi:hypothetical protein